MVFTNLLGITNQPPFWSSTATQEPSSEFSCASRNERAASMFEHASDSSGNCSGDCLKRWVRITTYHHRLPLYISKSLVVTFRPKGFLAQRIKFCTSSPFGGYSQNPKRLRLRNLRSTAPCLAASPACLRDRSLQNTAKKLFLIFSDLQALLVLVSVWISSCEKRGKRSDGHLSCGPHFRGYR